MADQIPMNSALHAWCIIVFNALREHEANPVLTHWEKDWLQNELYRLDLWGTLVYVSYKEARILLQLCGRIGVYVPPLPANDN